jgi:hypothetical protein
MRYFLASIVILSSAGFAVAGPYSVPAGQAGSAAIAANSPSIVGWATSSSSFLAGPQNISAPAGPLASFGVAANALGPADASGANPNSIVSLGDGGQITLSFAKAITNGPGPDFAVFENSFADNFLELAFVEVSTNGNDFVRLPAISLTPTAAQVASFGTIDSTNLYNLAGSFRAGFGTPFDLSDVAGLSPAVDVAHINFVRVVDVIGSINPGFAALDSLGNPVNDPYPTAFASGGFDLDAVGVINAVPEPSTLALAGLAAAICLLRRGRGLSRSR